MIKDKEISLILLKDFVFFPGKFLGGTMGKRILVLNPKEDIWKVFLWSVQVFKKKPCRVVFESDIFRKISLGYATEISRLEGDLIYSTKIDEGSYFKILEKWETIKRIREEND